jgi:type IV secretion system protein VirD4
MSELNTWAGTEAIKSQGLLPGREAAGVVIGTWEGEPLIDTTLKPVAVLGPCRSGKTSSILVPSLLTWQHSAVVLDFGGELFNLTERWRRVGAHNVVRRVQLMDSASPDSYNFLEAIRHDTPHELSDIQDLASSFVPDDGGDGRFTAHARSLVTLLVIAALSVNKSACMADVYEVLKSSDRINAIIDAHLKFSFDTEVFRAAQAIATALAELDDWTRAAIAQVAAAALTPFASLVIAQNTRRSSFNLSELQGRPVPTTVYLTVMPHHLELLRPLIHAFLAQFTRCGTQDKVQADANSVLLVLDDFVALGRLEFLESKLADLPESGIKPMLAVQSLDQLERQYGPDNGIWRRCAIRIILRPNQVSTADMVANAICDAAEQGAGRRFPRKPILPAELMQMRRDEAFILGAAGQPIHTVVGPYFRDAAYETRVGTPNTNPILRDAVSAAH